MEISLLSMRNKNSPAMRVEIKNYIQDRGNSDILQYKLRAKEYEGTFKGEPEPLGAD